MAEPFYKCKLDYVTFTDRTPEGCLRQLADYIEEKKFNIDIEIDDLEGTLSIKQYPDDGEWAVSAAVNHG